MTEGWAVTCPVCGFSIILPVKEGWMSMTIRCRGCDSSLGTSPGSDYVSVVYTEVPMEKWKHDPDEGVE